MPSTQLECQLPSDEEQACFISAAEVKADLVPVVACTEDKGTDNMQYCKL